MLDGHAAHMSDNRIPTQLSYGELTNKKRQNRKNQCRLKTSVYMTESYRQMVVSPGEEDLWKVCLRVFVKEKLKRNVRKGFGVKLQTI